MKITLVLWALIVPLQLTAPAALVLKPVAEIKGFSSPESIAWDGTHYYVSNVGKELKPTEKDGDGFISRMDAKGANLQLEFIGKLNAPKGMLVVGNTLYVCDIDVLLGFDLASKEKTFEVSFAKDGVRFLNDVCAAGAGKLMVSATDKNLVYLVDLNDKSATQVKFDKAPKGPNGLAFITADKDAYLLVAEWGTDNQPNGSIRAYRLEESLLVAEDQEKPKDLQMKDGYMDGLAVIMKNGEPQSFLYSDWVGFRPGGKLIHCNTETDDPKNSLTELAIPNGPVAGPADFFYDPKTSTLVLPCMMDGRVLLMKLEDKE